MAVKKLEGGVTNTSYEVSNKYEYEREKLNYSVGRLEGSPLAVKSFGGLGSYGENYNDLLKGEENPDWEKKAKAFCKSLGTGYADYFADVFNYDKKLYDNENGWKATLDVTGAVLLDLANTGFGGINSKKFQDYGEDGPFGGDSGWAKFGNWMLDFAKDGIGFFLDNALNVNDPHREWWEDASYRNRVILYNEWGLLDSAPDKYKLVYTPGGRIQPEVKEGGVYNTNPGAPREKDVKSYHQGRQNIIELTPCGLDWSGDIKRYKGLIKLGSKGTANAEDTPGASEKLLEKHKGSNSKWNNNYQNPLAYIMSHPDFETTKFIAFFTDKDGKTITDVETGWNYYFYCDEFSFNGVKMATPARVSFGYEDLYVSSLSMAQGDTKFSFKLQRDLKNHLQRYIESCSMGISEYGHIRSNVGFENKECDLNIVAFAGGKTLESIKIVHFKLPQIKLTKIGDIAFDHSKLDVSSSSVEGVARKVLYRIEKIKMSGVEWATEEKAGDYAIPVPEVAEPEESAEETIEESTEENSPITQPASYTVQDAIEKDIAAVKKSANTSHISIFAFAGDGTTYDSVIPPRSVIGVDSKPSVTVGVSFKLGR